MALLLRDVDVESLIDMPTAVEITRAVLREQAAGHAVPVPPRFVWVPGGVPLRYVSGALTDTGCMGIRVSNSRAAALALLYDTHSGELLTVMGYPFSTMRTGAMMAAAADLLATREAKTLAMIGTGRSAMTLLQGACAVRRLAEIRVFSRSEQHRQEFAAAAQRTTGVTTRAVTSVGEATPGAEMAYVATSSTEPVLLPEHVAPGMFVGSMGLPTEVAAEVLLAADVLFVSQKRQEQSYADNGDYRHILLELIASKQLDWPAIPELCQVLTGVHPGRTGADQLIVFRESQGGFHDVALAHAAYERAKERGLGQAISFFA